MRARSQDIYFAILDSSDGKDKIAKTLQYTGRLLLWLDRFDSDNRIFIDGITKNLSLFRKLVRFGDWIPALAKFIKLQQRQPSSLDSILDYISAFLSIYTPFWDDITCLGRLGIIKDARISAMAESHAANGWFIAICINLYKTLEAMRREEEPDHKKEQYNHRILLLRVNYVKLLSDLCFCSFDTLHIKKSAYISQTVFGLISAILGLYRMQIRLRV